MKKGMKNAVKKNCVKGPHNKAKDERKGKEIYEKT